MKLVNKRSYLYYNMSINESNTVLGTLIIVL